MLPDCSATVMLFVAAAAPFAPLQVSVYVVLALSAPVLQVPVIGLLPDQPPEAVQVLALLADQLSVAAAPLLIAAGLALRLTAAPLPAVVEPFTWIENAGSDALICPSVVPITMLEYVPTFAAVGVPASWPVDELKLAHEGLLFTWNVSRFPPGSFAAGRNE